MAISEGHSKTALGDALIAAQVLTAVAGAFVIFTMVLNVAGCTEQCNYEALELASKGFWLLDLVIVLVSVISYYLLRRRIRLAWVVPALGIGVEAVLVLIAVMMISEAFGPVV